MIDPGDDSADTSRGWIVVRRLDDFDTLERWDERTYETEAQALAALDRRYGSDHGPWEVVSTDATGGAR